ncbi:MAG: hypothetical protein R2826_09430 [Thermoleophilia bacterium]
MPCHPTHRAGTGLAVLALVCSLCILFPTAAVAADGVALLPPAAWSATSAENPVLNGPMLAFETYALAGAPVRKSATAKVHLWNMQTGAQRRIGLDAPAPAGADQRHPTIVDQAGDVYVVWQQRDAVAANANLWLWRGDESGAVAAGYPRVLVSGPAGSQQTSPHLGLTTVGKQKHLVVAWEDDRNTGGASAQIYVLDLSADGDGDGVPNYLEATFNPAVAGMCADPTGNLLQGQHSPTVGAKGVFWLDDRRAAGSGESDVYRASLAGGSPVASVYWKNTVYGPVSAPCATDDGAAWLGPGIAGAAYEPWLKKVDGSAGILTFFGNPGVFAVAGQRFAFTGGHKGATDTDPDLFFYDRGSGQNVGVCTVGGPTWNRLKIQTTPAIAAASGGSRIVWADSRQSTNTAATGYDALAYTLYVAHTPTVTLRARKTTIKLGQTVALTSTVAPAFAGAKVRFERGKRMTFTHDWVLNGTWAYYQKWTALATKRLTRTSQADWQWRPTARGTYWVRAWFTGGSKYKDGGLKVPHIANASKVIKIVVK